jgi:hypothetical protein
MELFLHNKIFEEQTLWWNLYSVTSLHQYLFIRFLGVSILQLLIIYRIYDYDMLTLSQ